MQLFFSVFFNFWPASYPTMRDESPLTPNLRPLDWQASKVSIGNREECLFEGEEGVEFCQKTLQDPKNLKFQYLIFLNVLTLLVSNQFPNALPVTAESQMATIGRLFRVLCR